jgi:8-oxo-dGTP diphosphatase
MENTENVRLTADVVLLTTDNEGRQYVLLIQRGWPPYKDHWALPGGHVDAGEPTAVAAHRELIEETGLAVDDLELVGVYANPGRDPRGRYVTFAYVTTLTGSLPTPVAGDDAVKARWCPVSELTDHQVAFDHYTIITDARVQCIRRHG